MWWGILCPLPPRLGGEWGHRGWWGAVVVVGGMVSEGRQCCWPPRLVCDVPRLCVDVPLVVYPVALLNGGRVCAAVSRLVLGLAPCIVMLPFYIVLFLLHHPALHCVCCHSIVGLGLCHCGMAVVVGRYVVWASVHFLFSFSSSSSSSSCGVRGSARAALRARTLSPNTFVSPLLLALSCFLCPSLFFPRRLSYYC